MITIEERSPGFVELTGPASNEQLSAALAASRAGRTARQNADENLGFDVPLAATSDEAAPEAPAPAQAAESTPSAPDAPETAPEASSAAPVSESAAQPAETFADLLKRLANVQAEQRGEVKGSRRFNELEAEIQQISRSMLEVQNRTPTDRHEVHDHCLLAKLRERDDVQAATVPLALAFADWQGETDKLDQAGLLPGSTERRIAELDKLASESGSSDAITAAAKRISELKSVSQSMQTAATMAVNSKLSACAEPFERLLNVYDAALLELREEAEIAEEVFFAGHGLPRTPTPVSGRVTAAQAVIARARTQIARLKGDDRMGATALRSWTLPDFCNLGE